jgi:hypothetical protein
MSIFCCKSETRVSPFWAVETCLLRRAAGTSPFVFYACLNCGVFHVVDLLARRALATAQIRMGSHAS